MGYKIDPGDINLSFIRSAAEAAGRIEEQLRSVALAHGRSGVALSASALATDAMKLRQALVGLASGETAIGVGLGSGPDSFPSWYVRGPDGLPFVAD